MIHYIMKTLANGFLIGAAFVFLVRCSNSFVIRVCDSANECQGSSLIASEIACRAYHSCRNATEITSNLTTIKCSATESCINSGDIKAATNLFCYGLLSCAYSQNVYADTVVFCFGAQSCQNVCKY